jgi:hypothetical protein
MSQGFIVQTIAMAAEPVITRRDRLPPAGELALQPWGVSDKTDGLVNASVNFGHLFDRSLFCGEQ